MAETWTTRRRILQVPVEVNAPFQDIVFVTTRDDSGATHVRVGVGSSDWVSVHGREMKSNELPLIVTYPET